MPFYESIREKVRNKTFTPSSWIRDTNPLSIFFSVVFSFELIEEVGVLVADKVLGNSSSNLLQEGQRLLDIGCGWGELILAAARQYRVKALGITLSEEQYDKVWSRIEEENLNELVEVQLLDYRELKDQTFDRVVSVGMLEHVGKEHLEEYFATVDRLLKEEGISLLHTITGRDERRTNSWINKYIFPGGYVPTVSELSKHMETYGFYLYDAESLRNHYTRTVEHWAHNFEQALPQIRESKDETFIRMWRLYLHSSAASLHSGNIDLHQFLFSKGPNNRLPWTRNYIYQ